MTVGAAVILIIILFGQPKMGMVNRLTARNISIAATLRGSDCYGCVLLMIRCTFGVNGLLDDAVGLLLFHVVGGVVGWPHNFPASGCGCCLLLLVGGLTRGGLRVVLLK